MNNPVDSVLCLTGNPFVDTGLAVLAAKANLGRIEDLTLSVVKNVHGDGSEIARWNGSLASFTMIFTSNSLLTNPAIKNADQRTTIYKLVLSNLLSGIGYENAPYRCESCGNPRSLNFSSFCERTLGGIEAKDQVRFIGRDWFPLSGSLGSDAQALPAASRAISLCSKCLFAVHYLPLGVMLLEGALAVFQSTSEVFWYELVRDIFQELQSRIQAGQYETLGAKEGSRSFLDRLLALFERLWAAGRVGEIPLGTTLQVWRFTNSGQPPKDGITCRIEEVPNPALAFLWKAARHGFRSEIHDLIWSEKNKERSFLKCIVERRDYTGLYPGTGNKGATPALFALYQEESCGRSRGSLALAHRLARAATEITSSKELQRLQRRESLKESAARNQFRRLMAGLGEQGNLTLDEYLALFPPREDLAGIAMHQEGWELIRYYLHYAAAQFEECSPAQVPPAAHASLVRYYATCIFKEYVGRRGRDRFRADVIDSASRGNVGPSWLRLTFTRLAEENEGFTHPAFEVLFRRSDAGLSTGEFMFQARLLWTVYIRNDTLPEVSVPAMPGGSGLPKHIEEELRRVFQDYRLRRGTDRFRESVLARLRKGELGLEWFRRALVEGVDDNRRPSSARLLTQHEWQDFLTDSLGNPSVAERVFQMHLLVANLYRDAMRQDKEINNGG
jgi:hypothetical protein